MSSLLPFAPSSVTVQRHGAELKNSIQWFERRGPQFAAGFLEGCGPLRKFLALFFHDPDLQAAQIVARSSPSEASGGG